MKKLLVLVGLLLAFAFAALMSHNGNIVESASYDEMVSVIRQVAKDYRAEQGFNGKCYVGDKEVSLGALLYALAMQEGGRRNGTVGNRTNNRGSLHGSMGLKKVSHYISADGTKTRPVYNTPYDGVYEKAHLIVTSKLYGCKISHKQLFSYIVGPNANPSKLHPTKVGGKNLTNYDFVSYNLRNLQKRAGEFDQAKQNTDPSKNEKQILDDMYKSKPGRMCYFARNIRVGDYIQLDIDGEMYKQIDLDGVEKNKTIKIFNCYGKKY